MAKGEPDCQAAAAGRSGAAHRVPLRPVGGEPRRGLSSSPRATASCSAGSSTPVGEIDIVARRRGVLVFVEVKARERLADAAEAIGKRQQSRIIAAAEFWLAGHPEDAAGDMRFDVVLVAPGRLPVHLPGAFDASM